MKRKTTEQFVKESRNVHGDKYDYSLVNYKNNKTKVKIICPEHGVFEQLPTSHILKKGCPKCSGFNYSKEDILNIFNIKHNKKYKYITDNNDYSKKSNKINILCKKHGIFNQRIDCHINGQGCPICKESKGEKSIREYLEKYKINYKTQFKFKDCKYKRKLPFDFYLPKYNTCIEYDGRQHYEINEYFGGYIELNNTEIRDNIKNDYCKDNNIKLIRIKYNDNIIERLNFIFNNFHNK